MRDYAFYHWRDAATGWRRLAQLPRRVLRRILLPYLQRQEAIDHELGAELEGLKRQNDALAAKVEELARQLAATAALGWDHVALARRLGSVEDQLSRREPATQAASIPRPHFSHAVARQRPV